MDKFNTFLDELKTLIETGFTVNGEKFLGTTPGDGVFTVDNYNGVEMPFDVDVDFNANSGLPIGPAILFHSYSPNQLKLIGGRKQQYEIVAEIVFSNESKNVGGSDICETRLARYFYAELEKGMNKADSFLSSASNIDSLGGDSQNGRSGNTTIYGATISFQVTF